MKFLVDAQLPKKLATYFSSLGFDAIHTLDLPKKNGTTDQEIIEISFNEKRIVVTKDADFYNSYLQKSEPYKLIFLTVGNKSTKEIIELFEKNINTIVDQIDHNYVVEISDKNIFTII